MFKPFHTLPALLLAALSATVSAQDATTKWMRLWNGKDLTGWKYQSQYFSVADSGMIIGKGRLLNYNTFCHTTQTFGDFELSVRARLWEVNTWYTNSGIQYRSRIADTARKILQGPQLDIGDGVAASMYPEGGYGGPGAGSSQACRTALKKSDWNHYIINANAGKVSQKIGTQGGAQYNLAVCNDFANTTPAGVIGLQFHFITGNPPANASTEVNFKDIYIRPLNNSFTIPDSLAVFLRPDYTTGSTSAVERTGAGKQGMAFRRGNGRLSVSGLEAGARLTLLDPLGRTISTAQAQGGRAELASGSGVSFLRAQASQSSQGSGKTDR